MSGKLSELSLGQRQHLVKRWLAGDSYADMAGYMDLDHTQIVNLFKQQRTKDLMAAEQGYYEMSTARSRLTLQRNQEKAADVQSGLLDSESEEMRYKASKFIIEHTMPSEKRQSEGTTINLNAEIELITSLKEAVNEFRMVPSGTNGKNSFDKYVLLGTEGIETVEPSSATPEVLGVGGSDGSGPTRENEADGKPEPPRPK